MSLQESSSKRTHPTQPDPMTFEGCADQPLLAATALHGNTLFFLPPSSFEIELVMMANLFASVLQILLDILA